MAARIFFVGLAFFLVAKLWFAAALPFTGDEAYFYWWGVYPALGYYDHPPMVGWLIALLRIVSESPLVLRLPTVGLSLLVAWIIADLVGRIRPNRPSLGLLSAALYLVMPITWIGVPITTDTPLIGFLCLSGYAFLRAELLGHRPRHFVTKPQLCAQEVGWLIASGLCLGLAFLSKYFAVVMAITYAVILIGLAPHRAETRWIRIKKLLILALTALPFGLLNLAYNAENCWNNIMFNGVNRHDDAAWGWENPLLYLAMLVYLITPWLLWALWRTRRNAGTDPVHHTLLWMVAVPFVFFLLISLKKTVGLHWVLAFLPFVIVLAAVRVSESDLRKSQRLTLLLSIPHLAFLVFALYAPLQQWSGFKLAQDVAFLRDVATVPEAALEGAPPGTVLMGRAYSPAALLGFHAKSYVPVFGTGRFHARQDDVLIDFRTYEGKTIRVVDRSERGLRDLENFFDSGRRFSISVNGRAYWIFEGLGFRFERYREQVLATVNERYYQIPDALPRGACLFQERYGFFK